MNILIRATKQYSTKRLKRKYKVYNVCKVTVECEVTTERNIRINNKHTLQ